MSGFGFRVSFWIGLAGSISERNLEAIELEIYLNFQPLRTYFEEEAATSTPRVIHRWKGLVKPDFWAHYPRTAEEYLILGTRPTEYWYQNRSTESENLRNILSAAAP